MDKTERIYGGALPFPLSAPVPGCVVLLKDGVGIRGGAVIVVGGVLG